MSIEREMDGKILVPEYLPEGVNFLDQPPFSWIDNNFWNGRFNFSEEERRSLIRLVTGVAAVGVAKFDLDRRISTYSQLRKKFETNENKVLSEMVYSVYKYLNNYHFSGSYVREKKRDCDGDGYPKKYPDGKPVKVMTYPGYAYNFQRVNNMHKTGIEEVASGSAGRWYSIYRV